MHYNDNCTTFNNLLNTTYLLHSKHIQYLINLTYKKNIRTYRTTMINTVSFCYSGPTYEYFCADTCYLLLQDKAYSLLLSGSKYNKSLRTKVVAHVPVSFPIRLHPNLQPQYLPIPLVMSPGLFHLIGNCLALPP